ncbi:hypothetical protein ABIA31_003041 [Catenulispora sp. MAP5-51]
MGNQVGDHPASSPLTAPVPRRWICGLTARLTLISQPDGHPTGCPTLAMANRLGAFLVARPRLAYSPATPDSTGSPAAVQSSMPSRYFRTFVYPSRSSLAATWPLFGQAAFEQ